MRAKRATYPSRRRNYLPGCTISIWLGRMYHKDYMLTNILVKLAGLSDHLDSIAGASANGTTAETARSTVSCPTPVGFSVASVRYLSRVERESEVCPDRSEPRACSGDRRAEDFPRPSWCACTPRLRKPKDLRSVQKIVLERPVTRGAADKQKQNTRRPPGGGTGPKQCPGP